MPFFTPKKYMPVGPMPVLMMIVMMMMMMMMIKSYVE